MFQPAKTLTKNGYPLFIIILAVFIFPLQSFGFKIISNDTAFADRTRPLIVLNIPSSDCIMCRAISIKILKELSDSVYRSRLIVLSDTRGMSFFYNKNDSVFKGFEKVYNPEYSAAYADSLSSTLCLLTSEGTQIFPLKKVSDSILNLIRKSITSAVQAPETKKDAALSLSFVDSLLPGGVEYENVIFDGKSKVAVFNSQIQLGYVADLSTGSVAYDESDIDTNTMKYLIATLKKMGIDSTCDLAKTLKTLKSVGLNTSLLKKLHNGNILFQFNSVVDEPQINDTAFSVSVLGRYFFAVAPDISFLEKLFLINAYGKIVYIEHTRMIDGSLFKPLLMDYNYCIQNDTLICLYGKVEPVSWRPTAEPKIKLIYYKISGMTLKECFRKDVTQHFSKYHAGFLRAKGKQAYFFNQPERKIIDLVTDKTYPYPILTGNNSDELSWMTDFDPNTNIFTGLTKNKAAVAGKLKKSFEPVSVFMLNENGDPKQRSVNTQTTKGNVLLISKNTKGATVLKVFQL